MIFRKTDPPVMGATASGGSRRAALEIGIVVRAPRHPSTGDLARIDTRDDGFVERVSE